MSCLLYTSAIDMHFFCDLSRIFLDGPYIFFRNMYGRDDAGGVSGMYAGKLDMLHNRWNECVGSVADRVCLALEGVVQEPVDQDRTVRRLSLIHI